MGNFDAISFRERVDIKRNDGDTCEYEVCEKAMEWYEQYPCYKDDWEKKKFQNTLNVYYQSGEDDRADYEKKSKSGYKGAYLLVRKDNKIALTADILTSICYPFTSVILKGTSLNGEGLRNLFKDMDICGYSNDMKGMYPYMKAFAQVYYWCGNMMPVPSNPNRGMHGIDHWRYKIEHIKNCFDVNYDGSKLNYWKKDWYEWIEKLKNQQKEINDFINDYFLEDCFVNGTDLKNMNETNSLVMRSTPEQKQTWLLNNTKMIIQRSYRIENNFHGIWDEENIKRVQQIFKLVFDMAGLDCEKNKDIF